MSQLRVRKPVGVQNVPANDEPSDATSEQTETGNFLNKKHWIFLIIFCSATFYCCYWVDGWLPKPMTDVEAGVFQFSEERARKHLTILAGYGPKPTGSFAAEVLTRNYIIDQVEKLKSDVKREKTKHGLEISVQKPSGCFDLKTFNGTLFCYKNVTNIVVLLTPVQKLVANHSVLMNCHFDSVPDSPGATDDLVSCSIMLEILYVLIKSSSPLTHNVIFLFNGAEEKFLQGAHGFITQYPLRHTVRAFVNLEGAGAGGREFLFQSGPANMWLLHAYLDSANRPHGSVFAQEMFESGIILSDTDFRIFRDFGRISGLDIAYVKNGYLYHTEFDKPEYIPDGSVQRAGENILATLKTMANSPCINHPCPDQEQKIIFFDFLGLFVVQYSLNYAIFFNIFTCVFVILKVFRQIQNAKNNVIECKENFSNATNSISSGYTAQCFVCHFILHFVCLICILVGTFLLTLFVRFVDLTLCWYSQPLLIVPLYVVPLALIGFWIHIYLPRYFTIFKVNDCFVKEQLTCDASLSLLSFALFVLTLFGVRSTYCLLTLTLFPSFRDILRTIAAKFGFIERNAMVLYVCHVVAFLPGSIVGSYSVLEAVNFLIPMMGRASTKLNPEFMIGGICAVVAMMIVIMSVSLAHVSREVVYLMKCLLALALFVVLVTALTPFGAPYKFDISGPRWRRLHIQHVHRRLFLEQEKRVEDNGIWFVSKDYRGVHDLPQQTFLQGAKEPYCLQDDEFCGLPYYLPRRGLVSHSNTLWLSVPTACATDKTVSLRLLSKEKLASNKWNYTFSVDGSDHMSVFITPINFWQLNSISYTSNLWNNNKTYFLYLVKVNVSEPWIFSVVIQTKIDTVLNSNKAKLLLGAASHQLHGKNQYSDVLKTLVETVRSRRTQSELTKGYWKWAMTTDAWCSDYLAQYFE